LTTQKFTIKKLTPIKVSYMTSQETIKKSTYLLIIKNTHFVRKNSIEKLDRSKSPPV